MSSEPAQTSSQESTPGIIVEASPEKEGERTNKDRSVTFLREIQEKAGQISESEMEEENLVAEFFDSLLKILKPFQKTLEVPTFSLPKNYNERASRAYLYYTGQLVLIHKNGELEIIDLKEKENHDLLIDVTSEIMAQLKEIIDSYKSRTERRVEFLMLITKELQKVAKVFTEE